MPVEEFVSAIGYTKDDLRDRNVLDLAARMQVEIDAGPSDVRVTDRGDGRGTRPDCRC